MVRIFKHKKSELTALKIAVLLGKISANEFDDRVEEAEPESNIKLLDCSLKWYFETFSFFDDPFDLVENVCKISDIRFSSISVKRFFSIMKAIKIQTKIIADLIEDIQYPELTEIQKQAGYGSRNFGTSGMICNLANAFGVDYLTAEKQPVISLTKLRMDAHLAKCQAEEARLKKLLKTE